MKEFNFEKELLGVQDELFRFAYKLTANREKAEDLLQDTLLKAMLHKESYNKNTNFKGWLFIIMRNTQHPLDEALLKEINKRVTLHTISYRSPEAIPGEYTTTDMAAGDTVFGDHEQLIAKVPKLLESTEKAIASAAVHPMILAARFHGFYEYLQIGRAHV